MKKLLILALAVTEFTQGQTDHIKNIVSMTQPESYEAKLLKDVTVLTLFFEDRVEIRTLKNGFNLDIVEITADTTIVLPRESD